MFKEKCKSLLSRYTKSSNIIFTNRGNVSINISLKIAKLQGVETVIIQDQGGWMTYPQFIKKNKLTEKYIETNYGLISSKKIKEIIKKNEIYPQKTALLVNSLSGYCAPQEMKQIYKTCNDNNILVINDVSGSIGTKIATNEVSDIIIGSFGNAKPIDYGSGGFIAFNDIPYKKKVNFPQLTKEIHFDILYEKLKSLKKRRKNLIEKSEKIKQELKDFDIIHENKKGINVIVKYESEDIKENIINYCYDNYLEYTECPRYIRVNDNAISIEVKRIKFKN